ncbi:AsmA family protein [Fulvivirga sp. RKSG066]|uniref:AsmA family protein n=1 Tax=Fulvivirga aurantia TaxID=2529383 RepID=UPI0012BCE346|nr:AsmA-like C-terminal region-containing protein [Fulvivirga aurantia]MTI20618.1 AsmA family protein [Fulvivirga aurantia]
MKKLLIVIGSLLVIILAAAAIVPVIFKDDIKAAIDKSLEESVNADIVWDTEDFGISLFKNFPNATANLNNFGIFNRAPFDGQLLFAVKEFEVEVDIFSLFGDQIQISGVELNEPQVFIKLLEDGTANYDIAIADDTQPQDATDTTAAAFNIGIDHWRITNGHIIYDDATIPFSLELKHVEHTGSGDFTQDVFDLVTNTTADSVTVVFDGTEYVTNKQLKADATLSISEEYTKYTFKENQATINDFALGFDGFLKLNEDGSMDMDLTYDTKENTFKSLLSLVPGMYTKDFEGLESSGSLTFNGAVKGRYDSLSMPAFNLAMQVDDAMFKYPDLPTAVDDIKLNLFVDNQDGNIDNTLIDLKEFHMQFGQNPVDARLLVKNLKNYDMEADIQAKLNLAELNQMFPMEGTSMKGLFNIDFKGSGIYDSIANKFPAIDATMSLKEGYVKTSEFPYAMEDLHFDAKITDKTGTMKDFTAVINDFTMIMDGERFKADVTFANLENYNWDVKANGGIDLEKITKVFPLEGMELAGKIKADLATKGNMADLEAERYSQLPTSGSVTVNNFNYKDQELPYDVSISSAKASFNPQEMRIENFSGVVGKSDMNITGSISNYIGYIFGDNEVLKGSMTMKSNLLDLNEFMTEEEDPNAVSASEEESYGVIQVPENIDFTLSSSIKSAKMMDMEFKNATGDIIVRNGIVNLSDLKFNLLEGQFAVNGSYNAKDIKKPMYDLKLNIEKLSIQSAFKNFEIVKQYVPIANLVDGDFSTDFSVNGLLNESMMPELGTITGAGLFEIAQATMSNSKILNGIASLTNLNDTDKVTMRDVLMKASIKDGKLQVEPFDVNLGSYKTTISGATALDGTISYGVQMQVPAGKLGSQFNSFVSSYTGGSDAGSSTIPVTIGLGGTVTDPQPKLMMSEQKAQAKEAVKKKLKEEGKEAVKDVANDLLKDQAKDAIGGLLGGKPKSDSVKADSTKKDADLKQKLEEDAKNKVKNLFKKKKSGGN